MTVWRLSTLSGMRKSWGFRFLNCPHSVQALGTPFLPYARIGRTAFRETPDIVLFLLPRGGSRPLRLPVPPAEYGAVRKVLEEKKREGLVQTQERILGL